MSKEFYKICLRHAGDKDNVFIFWAKEDNGYTFNLDEAELYEESDVPIELQLSRGDFLVHKDIIESLMEIVKDNDLSLKILPNIGINRKKLGITILNFKLDGQRNYIYHKFIDNLYETFKIIRNDQYIITIKPEYVNKFSFATYQVKAKDRIEAVLKTMKNFNLKPKIKYYDFKTMIFCRQKVNENKKYIVKGKPSHFKEFWLYENVIMAKNRNEAVQKTRYDWNIDLEYSYFDFKKIVYCELYKEKVLKKWVKLKND